MDVETTDPSSEIFQRNNSFIINDVDNSGSDDEGPVEALPVDSSDAFDNNQLDRSDLPNEKIVENESDIDGANNKNRRNKPPNLKLFVQPAPVLSRQNARDESTQLTTDTTTNEDPIVLPALKAQIRRNSDVGNSSPIVKRSSMLEKILEIPDVKAALVIDEGYEMLRKHSFDKTCVKRQPTPACDIERDRFSFDQSSSKDGDSESISESDTSSIHSSCDVLQDNEKSNARRPHCDVLKESKLKSNFLDRIADSTGPATVFGTPIKKQPPSELSPSAQKKWRKKANSVEDEDESVKPPTPRSRALLKRLKFAAISRSGSNSSLEGWDSLTRALARVGVAPPPSISLEEELHPKLSPILKRRSQAERWSSESSSSSQVSSVNLSL